MIKKIRIIISSVLFIPLIWLYTGWVRNMIYVFNPDHNWDIPFKFSPVATGILITFLTILITYLISMGMEKNTKYKIWGIALLILSAPLADTLGAGYALLDENHFAYLSVLFFFPILLIPGIVLLLIGFFRKPVS